MRRIFTFLVLLICCNYADSQISSISRIDSIVSVIDTSIYKQKSIEGKVRTQPGRNKGNITETYYLDTISQQLRKVEMAESLRDKGNRLTAVELTTYYYHNHKLIMVKTCRFDTFGYPGFKKSLSSGTYYYEDDNVILNKEIGYRRGGIVYISKGKSYTDFWFRKVFPASL